MAEAHFGIDGSPDNPAFFVDFFLWQAHFGIDGSPDISASAEEDPELHEALSRSLRDSQAAPKLPVMCVCVCVVCL